MTREIILGGLGGGYIALVDDDRYEDVNQYHWTAMRGTRGNNVYATRHFYRDNGTRGLQLMHGFITGWKLVDHINHDGLDNRMVNLRPDPGGMNQKNRSPQSGTSSPYKGVKLTRRTGRWEAQIRINDHLVNLGTFKLQINAALAYDAVASPLRGEWACLNRDCFPEVMLAYHGYPH